MRLFTTVLVFTISISACYSSLAQTSISKVSTIYLDYLTPTITGETYNQVLVRIKRDKSELKRNKVSMDSCRAYFLDQFENHVFPHWIGCVWDYNGYTNVPGKDKLIACGYFVSTPLKHMGFNWNRYELAKMYSKRIVETITPDIIKYTDKTKMILAIKNKPDNLYIVGLDSHVGMILKTDNRVWFVHSNYYGLKGPDKEIASISQAFADSESWYVGTFLTDENLRNWMNGTLINTVRK